MYFKIIIFLLQITLTKISLGAHFNSNSHCSNMMRSCIDKNEYVIEGEQLKRECWVWEYSKICDYPSKNDCNKYKNCYFLKANDCLMYDSLGNCVNLQKEFSCKRWQEDTVLRHLNYEDVVQNEGEDVVCLGVPCIDGNCIDKSYEVEEDLVSSVSQLQALSQGKSDGYNFKIFEGKALNCSKKALSYIDCCKISHKTIGWGEKVGAHCSKNEIYLMEQRAKDLCVYIGKKSHKTLGVTTLEKYYFCCFNNLLEKAIQVQARAQLNLNFGKAEYGNCRGFTLEELDRISWEQIDYSGVAAEIYKRINVPHVQDIKDRIQNSVIKLNSTIQDNKEDSEVNLIGATDD